MAAPVRVGFAFDYGDPVLLFETDQFSPVHWVATTTSPRTGGS